MLKKSTSVLQAHLSKITTDDQCRWPEQDDCAKSVVSGLFDAEGRQRQY